METGEQKIPSDKVESHHFYDNIYDFVNFSQILHFPWIITLI